MEKIVTLPIILMIGIRWQWSNIYASKSQSRSS